MAYFGSADGYLYAVDVKTGNKKWRFKAPFGWMRSSPAVANGLIYFGSDDGNPYAWH
jgi:eukaryotic-like serine/threonine-protein kinase